MVDPREKPVIAFYSHYPASSCIEVCSKNIILDKQKRERMRFKTTLKCQKSEAPWAAG